jgi:uncharacterized protein
MKHQSSLYTCEVFHVRVKPLRHKLRMKLFYLLLDVDRLHEIKLNLFSYNRFNLFSISDREWGKRDGTPIAVHLRLLAEAATGKGSAHKIFMLCLPALFGRVFNPITSYYCLNATNELQCMVFEVNNTFGHTHSYVVPADQLVDENEKQLHVSPFNKVEGYYRFKAPMPDETLHLSVQLFTSASLTLNTWVDGNQKALTDWNLLQAFARMPLLPLQVLFNIHWQAFKLWRKGLQVQTTPPDPMQSFSTSPTTYQGPAS